MLFLEFPATAKRPSGASLNAGSAIVEMVFEVGEEQIVGTSALKPAIPPPVTRNRTDGRAASR